MNNLYIFQKSTEPMIDQLIHIFNLKKKLSNQRTTIYQNENMRLSFDQSVTRVFLFENDKNILESLREFFYGEYYTNI